MGRCQIRHPILTANLMTETIGLFDILEYRINDIQNLRTLNQEVDVNPVPNNPSINKIILFTSNIR